MEQLVAQARKLMQENQLELANEIFLQILEKDPNNIESLYLYGTSLGLIKKFREGIHHLNKAIQLQPLPQFYHNLGLIYQETGEFSQALDCYQKALALNPKYHQAYHKLANTYNSLGKFPQVIENFQKAFAFKPDYAEGWLDLGIFLSQREQLAEAKECYEKALHYRPNFPKAYLQYGKLLFRLKLFEQSISCFSKALQLKPDYDESYVWLANLYEATCNWNDYAEIQKKLLSIYYSCVTDKIKLPFTPFSVLTYDWQSQQFAKIAKIYANNLLSEQSSLRATLNFKFTRNNKKTTRLKIGYLSCGFRQHPTGQLVYNLFSTHDRERFEIFAFSHGVDDQSIYRQQLAKTAEHFIDIANLSDLEAAKKIYESEIDILIELDGYIQGGRMEISALRPAPIQISYLGFPGTTGAEFIDYLIADKTVITPEAAMTYAEKIIYMPQSYQINNSKQIIAEVKPTRQQYSLPDDAFVYCCFNQNYKIDPKIFATWMNILTQVPKAVFWLYSSGTLAEKNLQNEAEKAGVDPHRIIFAKYEQHPMHLARLELADLFLDTLYYNAHTTTSDALWIGLPVLTYPGINFPSRVAASLLKAAGMPELIMPSLEKYREQAIFYARHPQELQKIRQKLAAQIKTSSLFNTEDFVKNLELAYLKIWEWYQKGQSPQDILLN